MLVKRHADAACITASYDIADAPDDPNVQADYPAAEPTAKDYCALIHYVNMRSSVRQWLNVEVGDVIAGFLPEHAAELALLKGVTFLLPDGKTYQQSDAGGKLQQYWDLHTGGNPIIVQFLLRLVP